jgi:LDH2 family malate/lactate/ureidoglycolate dehydrogenase
VLIPVDQIRETATRVLLESDLSPENAAIVVRSLVEAELRGLPSHGLLRLPRIVERVANGVADGRTTGTHTWTADAALQVDGQRGVGPVVAEFALRAISDRARSTGIAVASIGNSNHIGMLALYAEDIARNGQILIALTTSEALVHPAGGRVAMVGTNPIAIGVPAEPHPFVVDLATGVVSMGKVHDYAQRGEALQPGWALDSAGNPTVDAAEAKNGAIAPFGGPKGYALGLAFEVLVASLTASALGRDVAGTLDSTQVSNKGDVFIVAQPSSPIGAISDYLALIRDSPSADPQQPVLVPGDRARAVRAHNEIHGINIEPGLWEQISRLGTSAN